MASSMGVSTGVPTLARGRQMAVKYRVKHLQRLRLARGATAALSTALSPYR
jgi:hypothetical protein